MWKGETMKKIFSLLIATVLIATLMCAPVLALVSQSEDFYVADYANVLTSETKDDIIGYNGALEYQCKGAQVVVVTIESLDGGLESEEYAHQLFNDWSVGAAGEDNGMLLLLVTEEKRGWLALGAGFTDLSNEEINSWLDEYFWTHVDEGRYDEGVNSIFTRILEFYDEYYDSRVIASHPGYVAPSYTQAPQPIYTPAPVQPQDVQPEETNGAPSHGRVLWVVYAAVGLVGFIFWFIAPFKAMSQTESDPKKNTLWSRWLTFTGFGVGGGGNSGGGFGGGSGSGGGGSSGGGGGGR